MLQTFLGEFRVPVVTLFLFCLYLAILEHGLVVGGRIILLVELRAFNCLTLAVEQMLKLTSIIVLDLAPVLGCFWLDAVATAELVPYIQSLVFRVQRVICVKKLSGMRCHQSCRQLLYWRTLYS